MDRVVGGHDRSDALVHSPLEVRQVDLVQDVLIDRDVHREARVLHGVQRVVLRTRHDPLLRAPGQRRTELPEMVRLVSIGLLRASPGRVAGEIDAHSPEEVPALSADLLSDRTAYPLLELDVPRGSARHGDREGGAVPGDGTARTVDESDTRDAQPVDRSVRQRADVVALALHRCHPLPEGGVTVEELQPLVLGQLVIQHLRLGGGFGARAHCGHGDVKGGGFIAHRDVLTLFSCALFTERVTY